jgi:ribonuclease P protein component
MFRFRPAQRLLEAKAFSAVFAHRRVLRSDPFELYYRPSAGAAPRLGLVIPKRHAKLAVQRNLVKRLARESFRHCADSLTAMDFILRLYRPLRAGSVPQGKAQTRLWRIQMDRLFARLARDASSS